MPKGENKSYIGTFERKQSPEVRTEKETEPDNKLNQSIITAEPAKITIQEMMGAINKVK